MFKTAREYENSHIVLWIFKDTCWCCGWRTAGTIMILPTLAVAIDIARRSWGDAMEFSHNLAVCCWIAANAVWMIGEFFFDDSLRRYSAVFFALGCIALAWHYLPLMARWTKNKVYGDVSSVGQNV